MVPEELDVSVGAQPDVERQIPADVVRVIVDHDLVTVPHPVIAVVVVIGGNAKVETAEPKAIASSTSEMPNVAAANSAAKSPVLPRVIEVIVGVAGSALVSDPFAVVVNVRGLGVPGRIGIMMLLRGGRGMRLTT